MPFDENGLVSDAELASLRKERVHEWDQVLADGGEAFRKGQEQRKNEQASPDA